MDFSLQLVDDLINAYLFDAECYSSLQNDYKRQQILEAREQISRGIQALDTSDLGLIIEKYQTQYKQVLDEIAWREQRGKSRDMGRELVSKALAEVLQEVGFILAKKKQSQAAPPPTVSQEISAEPEPEPEPEPASPEESPSSTASISASSQQDREPTRTAPKKAVTKQAAPSPRKIEATGQHPKMEKTQKPTTSSFPKVKSVETTRKKTQPASTPQQPNSGQTGSQEKVEVIDGELWEEFSSASKPVEETPEGRIQTVVKQFLEKHPQGDWQERDRQDKLSEQQRFQKETELKKEIERMRELTGQKKQPTGKTPKVSPSDAKKNADKQKKPWWHLGRD